MPRTQFDLHHAAIKAAYTQTLARLHLLRDKLEWFEYAEILVNEGTDPLIALLTVDRTNPSNHYTYNHDVAKINRKLKPA